MADILTNIKGVIFDLDGVLTNTSEYHYLSWKKIADNLNLKFNYELNEKLKGVSRHESLDIILAYNNSKISSAEKANSIDVKNQHYLEFIETISAKDLLPGTIELLQYLRTNDYLIALGSASKNAINVLTRLGIIDYFIVIGDGNSVNNSKPAPDLFLFVANELNIKPEACIVIEDSQAGIDAANTANMTSIAIGTTENLQDYKYIFKDLEGLHKTLAPPVI